MVCPATSGSLEVADPAGKMDFALAFAVVHELAAVAPFLTQVVKTLNRRAHFLFAEPRGHNGHYRAFGPLPPNFKPHVQLLHTANWSIWGLRMWYIEFRKVN